MICVLVYGKKIISTKNKNAHTYAHKIQLFKYWKSYQQLLILYLILKKENKHINMIFESIIKRI